MSVHDLVKLNPQLRFGSDTSLPQPVSRKESRQLVASIKECSRSKDLNRGRQLHHQALQLGLFSTSLVVSNSLINMYAKCGCMSQARSIFDAMEQRDVVSWNTLLQGYADNGESELALQLFLHPSSKLSKVPADARTYVSAVKACGNLAAADEPVNRSVWLEKAAEIHSRAVRDGCCDVFVECCLITLYSRCGCMRSARDVFNKMQQPDRSVVAWNALLQGYADNGSSELVLELFDNMKLECVPNGRSYVAALVACGSLAQASHPTHEDRAARLTDDHTLSLNRWLRVGRALHSQALAAGCCDLIVQGALVDTYAKCRCMEEARSVYDKMPHPNAISFTSLLRGYVDNEEFEVAINLFDDAAASRDQRLINSRTYVVVLMAFAGVAKMSDHNIKKSKLLEKVRSIHFGALDAGCCDGHVESMLIEAYSHCGSMPDSRKVFDQMWMMNHRSSVSWTALLQGYVDNGESEVALELFQRALGECGVVSARTFVVGLGACASLGEKELSAGRSCDWIIRYRGKFIHAEAIRNNSWCRFVETAAVNMYAKCRDWANARLIFDAQVKPSVVTWNCLIQGYVDCGFNDAALEHIRWMEESGALKTTATFTAAIMACSNLVALERGRRFHSEIRACGLHRDLKLATCLVEFYGKCGEMGSAQEVFEGVEVRLRDVHLWNSLMSGFSQQGDTERVLSMFEMMREQGVAPNGISCSHVLSSCSHAGETERGEEFYRSMRRLYGIQPDVMHCNCVVDMLGRANRLEEALAFVRELPCEPDAVIWSTLLAASKKWHNSQVGEVAYKAILGLNARHSAAYVLMSNCFAG